MTIDQERAVELAIDHLCENYRHSIEIQASEAPDPLPYGFNLDGCTWFTVIDSSALGVGADKYIAVNLKTGEAQYFRSIGE